jgi:Protein of unknown function (DUF3025)
MSKRRFIAPLRNEVDAATFTHPIFEGYAAYRDWFGASRWPTIDVLNAAMPLADKRFLAQDQAVLDDGWHYENRIGERGAIATRTENWHDLFNAAVWCRYPSLKLAINAQQRTHIATMAVSQRNRAQYALTQFDEAGAVVCVRDAALLTCWDAHDWTALFHDTAAAWNNGGIRIVAVVGHALLEMALVPALYPVAKCVVVQADIDDATCIARVADAIATGRVLSDPLELRPLPLAGIPCWRSNQTEAFYATAGCFQPVRADRTYPPPLR